MTVMATSTSVFNISKIELMAYRTAGLLNNAQNMTAPQAQAANDALLLISESADTIGNVARVVEFSNVTLVNGTFVYSMPSNVVDVLSRAMYIDPTQADITKASGETPVDWISRDRWQELASKNATGRPLFYYTDRTSDTTKVNIWPIPSATEALGTIRFQVYLIRADVTDGNATLDFERYWTEYFVYALAAKLALENALPLDRVGALEQKAESRKQACKARSRQQGAQTAVLSHRTAWRGR